MDSYLGFIEFFVVFMFAMAWGILELVGRRLDRKKEAERAKEQNADRVTLIRTSSIAAPAACGTAAWPVRSAS